ncbi:MAG: hypothetical protein K9G33_11905 [Sneathiella sp.]|nr:hypothetical protein [Sneathiella sp.]
MKTIDNRTKLLRHCSLIGAIVFISLIIKILSENLQPYWLDEAYTIWFANLSFHNIWFWIPKFESHPPLYYSLVKIWEMLGVESIGLSYRGLSIFFSLMLVISSYYSVKALSTDLKIEKYRAALFNTFLICVSPVFFWYSIEARPYILLSLSYSIAILGALSAFSDVKTTAAKGWILFTFGAILTNWSHNLGGIFTSALFLALFVHWALDPKQRKEFLRNTLVCAAVVFLFSFPLIIQIIRQLAYWDASSWVAEPSITGFIQTMRRLFGFGYADKYMDTAFDELSIVWVLRISLGLIIGTASFLLACFGLYKLIRVKRLSLACFLAISCFAVPCASAIVSLLGPNIFLERTLLPVLVPYFMLLSISIEFLERRQFRLLLKSLYVVVLGFGLYATLSEGKKEAWNEVAENLNKSVAENDVVLLLPNDLILPIELYVRDEKLSAKIFGIPSKFPAIEYSDFYPDGFPAVPGIRAEDADKIRSVIKDKDHVFLITREEDLFDPNSVTRTVLGETFRFAFEKSWDNIHLYRFDRK